MDHGWIDGSWMDGRLLFLEGATFLTSQTQHGGTRYADGGCTCAYAVWISSSSLRLLTGSPVCLSSNLFGGQALCNCTVRKDCPALYSPWQKTAASRVLLSIKNVLLARTLVLVDVVRRKWKCVAYNISGWWTRSILES